MSTLPNLALGKPTTQSSIYPGGGGEAALAVDGITNGDWSAGSVTHSDYEAHPWWQVDLQGTYALSTVVLYNRTDCCSDRLQYVWVRVSEDGTNWQDIPPAPGTAPTQTTVTINRPARYVRVQLHSTTATALSLAEVQVFQSFNLALGKPTTQSSVYPGVGGAAALAVDGSTNGDWSAGSVTHTNHQAQPWWQVDLQGAQPISTVVLHNRTDCCSDRLQNFRVRVSEDGTSWQDFPYTGTAPTQTPFTINRPARYVRVQLDGTNALSLAEVQVFAPQSPGTAARVGNVVYGHWSSSGGRSPSSPANRKLLVDVSGPSEEVTFQLTSSANAYLYLLDANDNVLAEDDNGGGGTHARLTRMLPEGTYKLVAATRDPGQSAEFTVSADRALLRFPQRLLVQATNQFEWIYSDINSGAKDAVTVYRAKLDPHPGYYSLGDVAMPGHGNAPWMTFVVSGEGNLLAPPTDYQWIWNNEGSPGTYRVSFWDPVPPAGYTCLGTVTTPGYEKPSTQLIRCVKSEYVLPGTSTYVWDDAGSHAKYNVNLSQVDPKEHRGLSLSTFKGQQHYGPSDLSRFWVLNKSATANPELRGLPVDGQTAIQFAPRIWLDGAESYFPSSVEYFLANVRDRDGYLVTKEHLDCDSCTNPPFLKGQNPEQKHVPLYVEVVHRTQGDKPTNITDLIYWTVYPYNNGKRVCLGLYDYWIGCMGEYSTFGNHVGDLEHMTLRLIDGRPHQVFLSQHSGGQTLLYGSKWLTLLGWNPELYAALGSHGLYPEPGRHTYRELVNGDSLFDDTSRGIRWDGWVQPVVFPWQEPGTYTGSLAWLNITSRWGNPKSGCVISERWTGECVLNSGPEAPMMRDFAHPPALMLE
ncbi:discoidin domain-containing protein [Pyxidicoccus sp. MSG2]|uniref:galactose-binding domain-containing protein n=1 Tax=Pyxidicoccus sp. MSG2 TaxID=2996790 RepID=UPI002270C2AA|nr:discoidin domain-containing protein [Pyxidicoccus sp. MSG2]MCY1015348.1 discoidin domain-containing protein [Pyxidicoccus sp. MSG2]